MTIDLHSSYPGKVPFQYMDTDSVKLMTTKQKLNAEFGEVAMETARLRGEEWQKYLEYQLIHMEPEFIRGLKTVFEDELFHRHVEWEELMAERERLTLENLENGTII